MRQNSQIHVLAKRLRSMRLATGMSQAEIAERLGRAQSYISRCESGMRRIDIFELQEFARVYGKSIAFFVEGSETAIHLTGQKFRR